MEFILAQLNNKIAYQTPAYELLNSFVVVSTPVESLQQTC